MFNPQVFNAFFNLSQCLKIVPNNGRINNRDFITLNKS